MVAFKTEAFQMILFGVWPCSLVSSFFGYSTGSILLVEGGGPEGHSNSADTAGTMGVGSQMGASLFPYFLNTMQAQGNVSIQDCLYPVQCLLWADPEWEPTC